MRPHLSLLQRLALFVCLLFLPLMVAAEEVEVMAEVAKLLALDGKEFDRFGFSVSLEGDRLAIGAYQDDHSGSTDIGSAFVFERNPDGTWSQVGELVAPDGEPGDYFGYSVSLSGDSLAVGAWQSDDNGTSSGSAYVFERAPDGAWIATAKLLPFDGEAGDRFGQVVSLDGDRLAVGANLDGNRDGSVYVFERDVEGVWFPIDKLLARDGQVRERFGWALALEGDRLAIGAFGGEGPGATYIFERHSDGAWVQEARILPLDGVNGDQFGYSVSLDGSRLAVGAPSTGYATPGLAFVFERAPDGTWVEEAKLVASDGEEGDQFGVSVSLEGDLLAVGAVFGGDDEGTSTGSVYLFVRGPDGTWVEEDELLALDGQVSDFFGTSVSLEGGRLAVGAERGEDDSGVHNGSTYIFDPVVIAPSLTISGTCPGEIQLSSSGSTPRSRFGVYGSPSQGSWEFEGAPCFGTVLDLDDPASLRQTDSDFDAQGLLIRTVGVSWCGSYLQLLDERTCLTSEVVQVPESLRLQP